MSSKLRGFCTGDHIDADGGVLAAVFFNGVCTTFACGVFVCDTSVRVNREDTSCTCRPGDGNSDRTDDVDERRESAFPVLRLFLGFATTTASSSVAGWKVSACVSFSHCAAASLSFASCASYIRSSTTVSKTSQRT